MLDIDEFMPSESKKTDAKSAETKMFLTAKVLLLLDRSAA